MSQTSPSMGRLTLQRTASRPDAPFQPLPNRNVAAMRWRVMLDVVVVLVGDDLLLFNDRSLLMDNPIP